MLKKYKKLIVILGIIILPLIYSVFYLIAFWNPYGNLDKIPVALVNLDKCENNCKSTELIDKLKEKNTFDFEIVNESKAEEGLVNKDYYAIIKIPQNFTSSFEENNHSTEIIYNPNKKTNYLASQIIGSAVNEIQSNLNSQTNKEITKTLTNNLKEVPEKTNVIKDGMLELKNGTDKLNNGSNTLYNGLNALNMGYKDFSKGLTTLKNGSTKLNSNYEEFNQALNTVSNSTNDFTEKTEDLKQIPDAANEIGNGISNIASNLTNYQIANNQVLSDTENTYKLIVNYVENNPDTFEGTFGGDYDADDPEIFENEAFKKFLKSVNGRVPNGDGRIANVPSIRIEEDGTFSAAQQTQYNGLYIEIPVVRNVLSNPQTRERANQLEFQESNVGTTNNVIFRTGNEELIYGRY